MTIGTFIGSCHGCGQRRPVWRYQPTHNLHLDDQIEYCGWCRSAVQPPLCPRCFSDRRLREEADPAVADTIWLPGLDNEPATAGTHPSA